MAILQGVLLTKQNPCYIKLPEAITKKYRPRNNTIRCEVDGYSLMNVQGEKKKFRILIAGGGVGGLVLALAAKKRGFDVKVFEKNLSVVRGEGRHRGPIQLQSSALAVLEAIDKDVGKQILEAGCTIGNRISGLADGLSGEWLTKFDLLTPAVDRGLPVTRVICRMTLQDILVNAIGLDIVCNESKVVDFIEKSDKVTAILDDGQKYDGDILVGADGIWSKVRTKLFGWQEAKYSDYTCYSGSADYVPPYIDTVGYRVFLGSNRYFVAVDVGGGKMQWYGFHKEPAGNSDSPRGKKKRLLELFGSWCSEVVELVSETAEHAIIRRDIYDRDMLYSWGRGRVTLLGDAAHPVQPNLGQGGCMAIEDCYQLILELEELVKGSFGGLTSESIVSALQSYERKRIIRVGIVHLVTRMASRMLSSYQPYYLDFGSGPLSFLTALRLKHPVIQIACMFSDLGMPPLLTWMTVNSGTTASHTLYMGGHLKTLVVVVVSLVLATVLLFPVLHPAVKRPETAATTTTTDRAIRPKYCFLGCFIDADCEGSCSEKGLKGGECGPSRTGFGTECCCG